MLVHQAFRFEIDPSDRTRSALAGHTGASRFAYNWGLDLVKGALEATRVLSVLAIRQGASGDEATVWAREIVGPIPWSLPALRRAWNAAKHDVAPWWSENSKEAYSSGLDGLARALDNWNKARTGERAGTSGFPTFKKRDNRRSCRFTTGAIKVVDDHHVQLPRIGRLRTKEPATKLRRPLEEDRARVLSATISEQAGRWFVSFGCEVERADTPAARPNEVVGVDLGVKQLAVLSSGEVDENKMALSRYQPKMAHLQRELSRRGKGSKRARRTKAKLARCHRTVVNVRRDVIHKLTSDLAEHYGIVVVEDLAVRNMSTSAAGTMESPGTNVAQKSGLNRSILDVAPAEIRRQLTYKLAWRGGRLIVADRWFPSSKICSSCGRAKVTLSLDERTYSCEYCGLLIDRDLNAALNLAAYGKRELHVAGSGPETVNARGGANQRRSSSAPMKREDGTARAGQTVTASSQDEAA